MPLTVDGVAIPSATYSTTQTATITNESSARLHLLLVVTALTGTTPSVTVTISAKDPASGNLYPLLTGAAVTPTVYRIGPGLTAAANSVANDLVPRDLTVSVTIGGTASPTATYSVGYVLSA